MKQLTVHIPDSKMDFFMELAHNLGFKVDSNNQSSILTQEQIRQVNEERRKIKEEPSHFMDWEEARKTLKLD